MSQPDTIAKRDPDPVLQAAERMEQAERVRASEQARIATARGLGHVPDGSGPEITEAPARGPVVQFMPRATYPDGEDGYTVKDAGYQGRKALRHADAFDVMTAKAASKKKPAPFTPAQVAMGRLYATLYEKHQSAGVRCSSLEAMPQSGGGSGGEYIDAVLRDRERLKVMLSRIGRNAAMVVRRQRPSQRGSKLNISDLRLVHAVCVEEKTMTDILKEHGWANRGGSIDALTRALREALDRMNGAGRADRGGAVIYGQPMPRPFA